jgi:GT2 family glycosyltransferase
MSVAAVIPHWNRRDLLEAQLPQLAAQRRRFDEVLVVDNGSRDGSAEAAERLGARVIRLDRNHGFAAAVNRGLMATRADWVAILNNDVRLTEPWLETLLAAAESANAWFAVGKMLSGKGPSLLDGAWMAISRGACPWQCGAGLPDGPEWNRARRIRMAPMTAFLARRRLFDEIGYLDEQFESYLEDADFALRCALAGLGGWYEPRAVAYHLGSATWGQWHSDAVRLQARNQVLLAAKHFGGQSRWPILAGQLLWGLVALRRGRVWAYLKGKLAGLRIARQMRAGRSPQAGALAELLRESEQEILAIQRKAGFDRYWEAYFWLSRP